MTITNIQAILFDNTIYTPVTARNWLRKHKYITIKNVDKTDKYLRYRIVDPKQFKAFITKDIGAGIKLIIGLDRLKQSL